MKKSYHSNVVPAEEAAMTVRMDVAGAGVDASIDWLMAVFPRIVSSLLALWPPVRKA